MFNIVVVIVKHGSRKRGVINYLQRLILKLKLMTVNVYDTKDRIHVFYLITSKKGPTIQKKINQLFPLQTQTGWFITEKKQTYIHHKYIYISYKLAQSMDFIM